MRDGNTLSLKGATPSLALRKEEESGLVHSLRGKASTVTLVAGSKLGPGTQTARPGRCCLPVWWHRVQRVLAP